MSAFPDKYDWDKEMQYSLNAANMKPRLRAMEEA